MESKNQMFKYLKIIHAGLVLGVMIFAGVAIFLKTQNLFPSFAENELQILSVLVPLFVLGSIPAGYFIYNTKIKKLQAEEDESIQFEQYKAALVIKYAFFESAGFFSILAYLFSGNSQIFMYLAIILIVFFINKPSEERYDEHVHPNTEND